MDGFPELSNEVHAQKNIEPKALFLEEFGMQVEIDYIVVLVSFEKHCDRHKIPLPFFTFHNIFGTPTEEKMTSRAT